MPRIPYITKRFSETSQAIIIKAAEICAEYAEQGFDLTLRQLYYQFVARGLIPNRQAEYNRLGRIISDARLAGLLDWDYIVDRTRELRQRSHWDDPADIISSAAESYGVDLWEGQEYRVEVWIEKDALVGVIADVCTELDCPYFSCRGYTSQSEMWRAGERLQDYAARGHKPIILHLGDHDPSGIDMTRDIRDRLTLFMGYGGPDVKRIALNMDQVEEHELPPNPAKLSDSRASDYIADYGPDSWELDALDPVFMAELIAHDVLAYRDDEIFEKRLAVQERDRKLLKAVSGNWDDLSGDL